MNEHDYVKRARRHDLFVVALIVLGFLAWGACTATILPYTDRGEAPVGAAPSSQPSFVKPSPR